MPEFHLFIPFIPFPKCCDSKILSYVIWKISRSLVWCMLFFTFCYTIRLTTDFCYLEWFSSIEFLRKEKTNLSSIIWHNLNGKIISKFKNNNFKKISPKKYQRLFFKRPTPIPILPPHSYNISNPSSLREANKIHCSPPNLQPTLKREDVWAIDDIYHSWK